MRPSFVTLRQFQRFKRPSEILRYASTLAIWGAGLGTFLLWPNAVAFIQVKRYAPKQVAQS